MDKKYYSGKWSVCRLLFGSEDDTKAIFSGTHQECKNFRDKNFPKYILVKEKSNKN